MSVTPKIYAGSRMIDAARFAVHIPARSEEEASQLFAAIGAKLEGELVAEISLCDGCNRPAVVDYTEPEPISAEEWPEYVTTE